MVSFFGDYNTTETVVIPFNAFTSDDPSASVTVTNLASTDVYIYKDGSLTQRTSFAGIAVDIDVDGIAGSHWVTVDLSDNTDAGFYADGSRYQVRMEGVTIDGATINAWIGAFSIGCMLRPTTAGRTLDVNATGEAGLDLDNTSGTIGAAQLGGDCITATKIADDAISSEHFNTGALTADAFAADALIAATFATGALTADAFAANALVAATFAASSLDGKGDWNTTKTGYTLTNLSDANAAKLEDMLDGTGAILTLSNDLEVDLVKIHGTALTETGGQLAGRFVNFFDQASATFNVATALSSFKATGFAVAGDAMNLATAGQQDIAELIHMRPTWYVNKSGNDGNSGTSYDDAFLTIGAAVSAAASGDKIVIGAGTYDETVDASAKGLELVGSGATISQNGAQVTLTLGSNTSVYGLTVINTRAGGDVSTAIYIDTKSNVRFKNCVIDANGEGILAEDIDNIDIDGCFVTGGEYGIHLAGTGYDSFARIRNSFALVEGWTACVSCAIYLKDITAHVENCLAHASHGSTPDMVQGIGVFSTFGNESVVEVVNCTAYARATAGTANAAAIYHGGLYSSLLLRGVVCQSVSAGGDAYDIEAAYVNNTTHLSSVTYDEGKLEETGTIINLSAVAGDEMGLTAATLVQFVTDDTGEVSAVAGSVAELAQGAAAGITEEGVADAVCDELLAGHTDAGSVGEAIGRLDDIQLSTDQIGSSLTSVTSPVATDGTINLYQYDDYDDDEGRSLEWTNSDGDWGDDDITDAEVELTVLNSAGSAVMSADGVVATPTGTQKVRVELTSAITADLTLTSIYTYQLRLTLANGRKETIAIGNAIVTASGFTS